VRRFVPLAIAIALTVGCLPVAARLTFNSGGDGWIESGSPAWKEFTVIADRFGRPDGFVVGIFSADVLAPAVRSWQATLEQRVGALVGVRKAKDAGDHPVRSLLTEQDVEITSLGPEPVALLPVDHSALAARRRQQVLEHPLYAGLLIARDGRATAILIDIERGLDDRAVQDLYARLRAALAATPPPAGVATVIGGLPVQQQAINAAVVADQRLTVPISILIHTCLLVLILRRLLMVLVPLASIASSLVWTYAIVAVTGRPLDAILGLIPPLVMGVAVSAGLHLVYAFASERVVGNPDPLAGARRRVALPLLLAALTTALGVLGLYLGPVPAVRQFAPYAAAGVLLAALAPYLWLWALAPWIDVGASQRLIASAFGLRLGARMSAIATWCLRHPWPVLGSVAALIAISVFSLGRLGSDANFVAALSGDDPVRQAHARLDRELTGTLALDLLIDLGRMPTADDLDALRLVTAQARGDATIPYCIGLGDLTAYVDGRARAAGKPLDRAGLVDDLRLGAGAVWRQFVTSGLGGKPDTALRVIARQRDGSVHANAAGAERIRVAAQGAFPGAAVVAASAGQLLKEVSDRMIPSAVRSVLLPLPVIALLLLLALRSLRLALLAMPVAALPLLFTYALLPPLGWPVDIGVSMIACIALGIIMDDSVHMAFALGGRRQHGTAPATGVAIGPVLLCACLAMAGSFLACMFGAFSYTRHFGILLALAFIIGLVVNLTVAPAVFALLGGRATPAKEAP